MDLTLSLLIISVVPRTFLGPLILSTLCRAVRFLCLPLTDIATNPIFVQFLARFFLMTINVSCWVQLALAVDQSTGKRGRHIGSWTLVVTACQFHIPFYASRMLPNTFALAIVLLAYSFWIRGNVERSAACIVFATAVFRCDILLLLGSLGLSWLISRKITILQALKVGVATGVVSLLLTVPMDSLLWQRFLWPEGEVFFFNTVLGKSSEWGTSPWHWYFTSALPKSMLLTILLVPLSVLRIPEILASWEISKKKGNGVVGSDNLKLDMRLFDAEWLPFLFPVIGFVVLYSNLGHKEMRFIFPALPILNLVAGSSLARLATLSFPPKEKPPSIVGRLGLVCAIACLLLTLCGNLAFVEVSRWNYPGGQALQRLCAIVQNNGNAEPTNEVRVHIDVASAMSGVSLFGQRAVEMSCRERSWIFDKSGYEDRNELVGSYDRFNYLLSESPNASTSFDIVDSIPGRPRLNIRAARVDTEPTIFILQKR